MRLITADGAERCAAAIDIDADGSLICSDSDGVFSVKTGEVSVRGLYGYV
ncbi:MAG: hypothetical protein LBV27_03910 [Oscillospiraceae bacterium]|nr:hypothetical protein [Oscillospiraceae bacterium]